MKQRIRVVGEIWRGGEVLLLKRAMGRAEEMAHYELPTGKINFGEQPEEAMARVVWENVGVRPSGVRLVDVITFTDLRGASEEGNLYIVYRVGIESDDVKITTSGRYTAYKWVRDGEVGRMNLDEASLSVLEIVGEPRRVAGGGEGTDRISYRQTANAATVYVDGGSRGNPGPAGIGYYILAPDGTVLKKGGEFIGFSTSRVAEYYALKEGVEQARELGLKSVKFVSDNLMVVNQMNGIYKVKNKDLVAIYRDILRMLGGFENYAFVHVLREQNVQADAEANRAIDEYGRGVVE
jgi:ribonuclease HI/ADP-ribose pyrophosphatase YjhB (NUDIX family)